MMKKLTALFLVLLLSLPAFTLAEAETTDPATLLESMTTEQKISLSCSCPRFTIM